LYQESEFILSSSNYSGNLKLQVQCGSNGAGRIAFLLFASNGANGINGYLFKFSAISGEYPGQIWRLDNGIATSIATYAAHDSYFNAGSLANAAQLKGLFSILATHYPTTREFAINVNGTQIAVAKDSTYEVNGPIGYGYEVVSGVIAKFIIDGHNEILTTIPILPDVTGLKAGYTSTGALQLLWNPLNPKPTGFKNFEVRLGTTWAGGTPLAFPTTPEFDYPDPPIVAATYFVGVTDGAGNYDPAPASITVAPPTTANRNLVPDSEFKTYNAYAALYWNKNAAFSVAAGAGAAGSNGLVYKGTGAASGYQYVASKVFNLAQGSYVVSGFIDCTNVTAGEPYWELYDSSISAWNAGFGIAAGQKARGSAAFTISFGTWEANTNYPRGPSSYVVDSNGNIQMVTVAGESGASAPTWSTTLNGTTTDGGVTWKLVSTDGLTVPVLVICDTVNCTVTSGKKLIFSAPQVEVAPPSGNPSAYKTNESDDLSGSTLIDFANPGHVSQAAALNSYINAFPRGLTLSPASSLAGHPPDFMKLLSPAVIVTNASGSNLTLLNIVLNRITTNGLDTGSLAANTLYYVYLVYGPSASPDLMLLLSLNPPSVGPNLTGWSQYTYTAFVGIALMSATAGQFCGSQSAGAAWSLSTPYAISGVSPQTSFAAMSDPVLSALGAVSSLVLLYVDYLDAGGAFVTISEDGTTTIWRAYTSGSAPATGHVWVSGAGAFYKTGVAGGTLTISIKGAHLLI
jgi:hypothetical protein